MKINVTVLSKGREKTIEGVVKDINGFKEGDILFSDYLDLEKTYAIVPKAKLIIVNKGGLLTHFAIIGREYGTPVIKIPEGINVIGKRIRVDIEKREMEVIE